MDDRQLRYLLAVSEARSVTKAAEQLYISQSALSHYIKNAELELGVPIFDRSTSPISLTYAGELYIESAKRILQETETLEKKIKDINHNMTGRIRIGFPRDRASYLCPYIIPEFRELYPNMTVIVYTDGGKELLNGLREGKVDFAILPDSQKEDDRGLVTEYLYSEEVLISAKPGYVDSADLGGNGSYIKLEALEKYPYYILPQGRVTRNYTEKLLDNHGLDLKIALTMDSNIGCFRMSASGGGLAMVPIITISMTKCDLPVDIYRIGETGVMWNINGFYRKGAYLSKPEQDFLEIVKKNMRKTVEATRTELIQG